jgi:hypothetical protein
MNGLTKYGAQVVHATRRARERYGLSLDRETYNQLVKKIRTGRDVKLLERESRRVSHYLVKHEDRWYPIVFDWVRNTIVTFLPNEYMKHHMERDDVLVMCRGSEVAFKVLK